MGKKCRNEGVTSALFIWDMAISAPGECGQDGGNESAAFAPWSYLCPSS